jgi:integration host factor subunit beta
MLKYELVQRLLATRPHLCERDDERIVNIVLDEIVEAFRNGDRVELRGFGTFTAKERIARTGRNPRTGTGVDVAANTAQAFKPGKEMRERLNKPEA